MAGDGATANRPLCLARRRRGAGGAERRPRGRPRGRPGGGDAASAPPLERVVGRRAPREVLLGVQQHADVPVPRLHRDAQRRAAVLQTKKPEKWLKGAATQAAPRTLSGLIDFCTHSALIILCSDTYFFIFFTHKFVNSGEQPANKVLSNFFIALLLHKIYNDYCQKVIGGLIVYVRRCVARFDASVKKRALRGFQPVKNVMLIWLNLVQTDIKCRVIKQKLCWISRIF